MTTSYIYDAVRTARGKGKKDGALHTVTPIELLKTCFDGLQARHAFDTGVVDDVVLGCVTPVGEQGGNIARVAALYAGLDEKVAGVTLNRFCASGLEAVNLAAMKVMSGQEDMVIAGGIESMSRWAMGSDGGAWVMDPRVNSRLTFVPQGISADLIATLENFSRSELDEYAARSHRLAAQAHAEGRFASRLTVRDLNGAAILSHDELTRADTSAESLSKLKASFEQMGMMGFDAAALSKYHQLNHIQHSHHAGNSSGIVDGASLVLIGNEMTGKAQGLRPRAKIRACAVIGSEPTIMLTGPAPSARKALQKAGMNIADIDLWEINEAFAAVPLKCARDLNIDLDKVNVNGGSIALGHPLGATGAMLVGTALDELERRNLNTALITLCVGAGMGIATIIERV